MAGRQERDDELQGAAGRFLTWERHGQSLLLGLISAGVLYLGNAFIDGREQSATLITEVKHLTTQVAELRGAVNAMQLQYVSRAEFAVHEQRLQTLEQARR